MVSELKLNHDKFTCEPVSKDFEITGNEVLYNAKKNLIERLLYESSKVIAKNEPNLNDELRKTYLEKHKSKFLKIYNEKLKKGDQKSGR